MLRKLIALTVVAAAAVTSWANDMTGAWEGRLKVSPQISLRLVFHIEEDAVTLDSPDQNAYGIKGRLDYLSADSVNLSVAQLGMNFAGSLVNDTLTGIFRQGPAKLPLSLTRGVKKLNRPQTPQPPFPYSTEEVTVVTPDATLAGTLTVPAGATQATPVAVLVSGSGLQNRDEELFGHRPFAVIADYLARNGIATLRYDDRGCGESKGSVDTATTEDFAADAEAVVSHLRRSGRFARVGLIGHSEGGMIGYMLGAKSGMSKEGNNGTDGDGRVVDFVVSIAGPAVSGAEINAYQNKVALMNSGVDSVSAEDFRVALLKALRYRLANPPLKSVDNDLLREIYPQYQDSPKAQQLAASITATLTMEQIQPWMEYFLRFDPAESMRALKVPTFIIYGEKDCQVPPSLNLLPARANAPAATVKCYPGLNHPMQHAVTGRVEEYGQIEETIAPEVLADIAAFIRSLR